MAPAANRRTYPQHPAIFPTPPSSDAPPSVVINVAALQHQIISQGPPLPTSDTPSSPPPNAFNRSYAARDRTQKTEDDLVSQIEKLTGNKSCPEIIKRAELRRTLAEKKSPDREAVLPLVLSAYHDLQEALRLAKEYSFDNGLKNRWLQEISTAQASLKTLAAQNNCILPEPSSPLATLAPVPSKTEKPPKPLPQSPLILFKRVIAGIFAALALVFTVGVAINHYLVKNR